MEKAAAVILIVASVSMLLSVAHDNRRPAPELTVGWATGVTLLCLLVLSVIAWDAIAALVLAIGRP